MDKLGLYGMKFRAFHGVLPLERETGNEFEVDVTIKGNFEESASSDDLNKTVDYSKIFEIVSEIITGEPKNLIETVASNIADRLITDLNCRSATVVLRKLEPVNCGNAKYASVNITKKKKP